MFGVLSNGLLSGLTVYLIVHYVVPGASLMDTIGIALAVAFVYTINVTLILFDNRE